MIQLSSLSIGIDIKLFNMLAVSLCILFGLGTVTGIPRVGHGGHISKYCYSCKNTADPHSCTTTEWCDPDSRCGTTLHLVEGVLKYSMGCYGAHDCEHQLAPIGKRAGHHHHEDVRCNKCCDTGRCNKDLCGLGATTSSTSCRDHEEDGFTCAAMGSTHFCTDNSAVAQFIANNKCPKYCGHCSSTTAAPTQPAAVTTMPAPVAACVDHEDNGFVCANFDVFNFCTDATSFAHALANEKCRKYCGICKVIA